jgi:phosphatidylserine/phosphatidylglycerophosphate/cardiolipin synthase-like enzyme
MTAVKFAPSGDARELQGWIADEIKKADKEILVAMYHFTSLRLADALVAAKKRGLTVRVLADAEQYKSDRSKEVWEKLKAAGVEVRRVNPKKGDDDEVPHFHHKFCVLDGRAVFTGSYNWTVQGDRTNHENLVLISEAETAKSFRKTFEATWSDTSITQP